MAKREQDNKHARSVCVCKRKHVRKAYKKDYAGKSEETKGRDGMGKKANTRALERALLYMGLYKFMWERN